ncbi:FIG01021679: hypothetical protein [hydrothermal vent metagenome]|uniref:ATP-grasp domain-containing protein n=1 Tax=hydrothermal vent metagenome TaxID=652676 RepID=A0A3B0UT58_9ZZZZ
MTQKIGLMVGMEWSWPPAFIEEVNGRNQDIIAEFVTLGGTKMDEPCPYAVIVDRISHEVPYYRSYLKNAMLQGTHVINNPFMWTADDKFFGASLITKLGIASPKTAVLPNKAYIPGIDHDKSLRNLVYPMPWQEMVDYIGGFPCILKDAHGGGWKEVYVCHDMEALYRSYDQSGQLTMVLQEFIHWDDYIRCMVLGEEDVLVMSYDPHSRKYSHPNLSKKLHKRIVSDCQKLCHAFGYDMNTCEFAVRDGIPYAIDFMNPAPDMDINSLGDEFYHWCVTHMADLCIGLVKKPRPQVAEMRWSSLF